MWILQRNSDNSIVEYFDNEFELADWVEENIEYSDRCLYTMIDPEGGEFYV